jgi:DNA-binding PadR family transcriptional regulator
MTMSAPDPRKAQRSSLGLIVLWLLYQQPRHVYAMQKLIEQQGKDRVVNVRSRASLYQTIERLQRHGLVEVHQTERAESRPERTVYALTGAGREAATDWLREMLRSTGGDFPDFLAAVSILFGLAPDDAQAQLAARAETITAELERTEAELRDHPQVPRLFLLEEEYRRTLQAAELDWLRGVIDDLDSGRLTWSEEWLAQMAAALLSPDDEEGSA